MINMFFDIIVSLLVLPLPIIQILFFILFAKKYSESLKLVSLIFFVAFSTICIYSIITTFAYTTSIPLDGLFLGHSSWWYCLYVILKNKPFTFVLDIRYVGMILLNFFVNGSIHLTKSYVFYGLQLPQQYSSLFAVVFIILYQLLFVKTLENITKISKNTNPSN